MESGWQVLSGDLVIIEQGHVGCRTRTLAAEILGRSPEALGWAEHERGDWKPAQDVKGDRSFQWTPHFENKKGRKIQHRPAEPLGQASGHFGEEELESPRHALGLVRGPSGLPSKMSATPDGVKWGEFIVSGWTGEGSRSTCPAVKQFLTSYRAKRWLGLVFSNSQSLRWMTQGRILQRAADEFRRSGIRTLDVGSGGGRYAIENHLRRGTPTMLCDYSADLLELARRQVADARVDQLAEFTMCSAEALPFPDSTYDFIQCMEVLEHLHHPAKALAEFRRVARPGARLVVSVPHPPEWFPNPEHVVEGYRVEEISQLIEAAGWRVVRSEYCMLILSRWVLALLQKARVPVPMNPLVALENLVPARWRQRLLPYDLVVIAESR